MSDRCQLDPEPWHVRPIRFHRPERAARVRRHGWRLPSGRCDCLVRDRAACAAAASRKRVTSQSRAFDQARRTRAKDWSARISPGHPGARDRRV